jgi:hypothetical protein
MKKKYQKWEVPFLTETEENVEPIAAHFDKYFRPKKESAVWRAIKTTWGWTHFISGMATLLVCFLIFAALLITYLGPDCYVSMPYHFVIYVEENISSGAMWAMGIVMLPSFIMGIPYYFKLWCLSDILSDIFN